MTTNEALVAALEPLRTGFRADGADIELVRVDRDVAVIRLDIFDDSCADECILPKKSLEGILLAALRRTHPDIQSVDLLDPRVPSADSH